MSIEMLKEELRGLPSEDRRKMVAFVIALEDSERAEYRARLTRQIDDRSPKR